MRILVVGSGGREHALVWKLAQSGEPVFCAPGNAGISRIAECRPVKADDIPGLMRLAAEEKIDLTVVGPEAPLAAGIADEFAAKGLVVFGPTKSAARLESDKGFAKSLMKQQGIPTADFDTFEDFDKARDYARGRSLPLVVKASGLAAGKGAVICRTGEEVEATLRMMMVETGLGAAGSTVVIEEFLEGEEASVIGICDGTRVEMLVPSQDHKALLDGDRGPNTGGMGAYAPAPVVTPSLGREIGELVFKPLLAGLQRQGIEYRGVIYAGMMLTSQEPKVLEFNCRFGDPETQAVLPLLRSDLGQTLAACAAGKLGPGLEWSADSAVCVVAASSGYPGKYEKGVKIEGDVVGSDGVVVFHAGTRQTEDGAVVTNGGRVLGVTGKGPSLREARDKAYEALTKVGFAGMTFRKDIAWRGLERIDAKGEREKGK